MRVIRPLVNGNEVSLTDLGVRMENWRSDCTVLSVKENPFLNNEMILITGWILIEVSLYIS